MMDCIKIKPLLAILLYSALPATVCGQFVSNKTHEFPSDEYFPYADDYRSEKNHYRLHIFSSYFTNKAPVQLVEGKNDNPAADTGSSITEETALEKEPDTFFIKGKLIDSLTNAGLGYVTVTVKEVESGEVIEGTFSSEEGAFELAELAVKRYDVIFTYIGYNTRSVRIAESNAGLVDLGEILLASSATQLAEIEIVAEKELLMHDLDKITYYVGDDPDSKTMMALDIFQKIPLLTLDGDDNLQLNGSSSYQVLINGKRSSLFVNNPSEVFRNMPANIIKSVEVITNPPSKYDAEGIAGIINVISRGKNITGYSGSVNLSLRSPAGFNQSGYLTTKTGRVGFSGNVSNNLSYTPGTAQSFFREDRIRANRFEQTGESESKTTSQYATGELSYEVSELDLITANVNFKTSNGWSEFMQNAQLWNSDNELVEAYKRINSGKSRGYGYDLGMDYQRSFRHSSVQLLTVSYRLNNTFDANSTDFVLHPVFNYKRKMSVTSNDDGFMEQTIQADYVHPIHNQMIEFGVKSIYRQNDSRYFYKNYDPATDHYMLDASLSNEFEYRQHIIAAYTSMSLTKNHWGLRAGARVERTSIEADFISSGTAANQNYFNVMPSVTLSRRIKKSSVRFSYTQRIERPGLYYLDPYVDVTDPRNISYGNPDLDPALRYSFQLGLQQFIKRISINTNLFHSFTHKAIEAYTTLGDDSVSRTTFANIGRSRNYGLSVSGNANIFKKLTMNVNTSGSYVQYMRFADGETYFNEGLIFNVYGSASYRLNEWRINLNFGYSSPNIIVQGRSAGNVWHSASLTKPLLKDSKGRISLSVQNPFQQYRHFYSEVDAPAFYQVRESYRIMRRFNLSFSYRFGKLKSDIPKKRRGIINDDLKTEGSDNAEN